VEAKWADGVLEVTTLAPPAPAPKRVEIRIEGGGGPPKSTRAA
jgi:hypothetical protein